jgi:hypothetical protein
VEWTEGKDFSGRLKEIAATDGPFKKIEGFATTNLENASDELLLRFGRQAASKLEGNWTVSIRMEVVKRFLVLERTN